MLRINRMRMIQKSSKHPAFPSRNSAGVRFPDRKTIHVARGNPLEVNTPAKNHALAAAKTGYLLNRFVNSESISRRGLLACCRVAKHRQVSRPTRPRVPRVTNG